jgi:hypothetical protein
MKKKFYHATKLENLKSIMENGLHSRFGNEIYFSSNPMSAVNWVGAGQTGHYALIQVMLDEKQYTPGQDHAPIMEYMYPGEVVVVNKPVYTFSAVLVYEKKQHATMLDHIVCYKHSIKGKPKAPWYKSKEQQAQEWDEIVKSLQKRLEEIEK